MLIIFVTFIFGFIIILYVFSPLISPKPLRLNGLHVLITGGSSGIGKYMAMEAIKQGANVTILSRNQEKLYLAKQEIENYKTNLSQKIVCLAIDVSKDYLAVKQAIDRTEKIMGRHVDVLVNCAGYASLALFDELAIAEFKNLMDVNYLGTIYATRSVIENMKKGLTTVISHPSIPGVDNVSSDLLDQHAQNNAQESNIPNTYSSEILNDNNIILNSNIDIKNYNNTSQYISQDNLQQNTINPSNQGYRIMFVSSQAGQTGIYGCSAYCASKFALRGLAESLQMEVKPYKIRITLAFPPDTDTPGYAHENLTKPALTKDICQTSGLYSPQVVAKTLIEDLKKGKFTSYIGIDGFLLNSLTCGMSPITTITEAIEQVCTMSLFRIVGLFLIDSWDRMIQKCFVNLHIK